MVNSEEAAQRFIITPHQGIERIYGEEEPTEVEREIRRLLRKPTNQLTPEELEFLDKHLGETHYEAHHEEDEEALLKEAEEILSKMEDYINNEPMTNMEKARGVESAYYEEAYEFCPLHSKYMEDHTREELEDDLNQVARMRD